MKAALIENRGRLGEAQNLQQFIRDAEDLEAWMAERRTFVMEESYKDPANIQVRKPSHTRMLLNLATYRYRILATYRYRILATYRYGNPATHTGS